MSSEVINKNLSQMCLKCGHSIHQNHITQNLAWWIVSSYLHSEDVHFVSQVRLGSTIIDAFQPSLQFLLQHTVIDHTRSVLVDFGVNTTRTSIWEYMYVRLKPCILERCTIEIQNQGLKAVQELEKFLAEIYLVSGLCFYMFVTSFSTYRHYLTMVGIWEK